MDDFNYLANVGNLGSLYGLMPQGGTAAGAGPQVAPTQVAPPTPPMGATYQPSPGLSLLQNLLQKGTQGGAGGGAQGYPGLSAQRGPAMIGKGTMDLIKMLAGL